MDQTERLLNLLGLLLEARTPVTFEDIRTELVDAYTQSDAESAKRMFERDKDALRDLGVPIETTSRDPWTEEANAYRIPKDGYYLPRIEFTPDEAASLYVAATATGESDDAARALRKLLFGADPSVFARPEDPLLAAGPDFTGPRLAMVADAIAERRQVRFGYRAPTGEATERVVDPYALVWRSGHYYLVGLDHDREAIRCFRVSRFSSEVVLEGQATPPPRGFVGRDHLHAGPFGGDDELLRVRIALSERVAWWALKGMEGTERVGGADGWEEHLVPGSADDQFVSWVLSFGLDARVLEPSEVRDAVRLRLEEVLA